MFLSNYWATLLLQLKLNPCLELIHKSMKKKKSYYHIVLVMVNNLKLNKPDLNFKVSISSWLCTCNQT